MARARPLVDDDTLATWRALLTAHARVTRRISRDLAEAGLPDLVWYDLLWALHRAPERRLRVSELAQAVALSPTGMSRLVDRVEAAGYVRREPDPRDRRALQVALTGAGEQALRRMWPVYAAGIEAHVAPFLQDAGPRLREVLQRMADSAGPGPTAGR